jgi:hypothetical protein
MDKRGNAVSNKGHRTLGIASGFTRHDWGPLETALADLRRGCYVALSRQLPEKPVFSRVRGNSMWVRPDELASLIVRSPAR